VPPKQKQGIELSWTTVTYRSVLLAILAVVIAVSIVLALLFPEQSKSLMSKAGDAVGGMLGKANQTADKKGGDQATFTQIDGTVRVKKANSNTWVNADYQTRVEKGDVIQTGSEGLAKVVFPDHTYYTIKQDSLIVIEENSTNTAQQTNVSVELTTGTVDLSTGTYSQGSKSQVVLAGATAALAPDSAAMVHNDPRTDQHEILAKKGAVDVARGSQVTKLTEYERASFQQDKPGIQKTKELAPPTLIAPANMLPVFVSPSTNSTLDFSWTPVTNAQMYRMRISRNPYFSSTVFDKKVPVPQIKTSALPEGAYYWTVQSVDEKGKESVESEKNRFTMIAKGTENVALQLDLDPFVQHGHTIEVRGKTEPSARVMVNGFEVPSVKPDGTFSWFTPMLPTGENVITITAQNSKGGVKTMQKKVVIQ
jgi:Glucodextranase, domain B/FecR protein